MNLYAVLGSGIGTDEALALSARLSTWHDAMVAHERRLRTNSSGDACSEDCPHADARGLWAEAVMMFGQRAHELAFLRSRADDALRRTNPDAVPAAPLHGRHAAAER